MSRVRLTIRVAYSHLKLLKPRRSNKDPQGRKPLRRSRLPSRGELPWSVRTDFGHPSEENPSPLFKDDETDSQPKWRTEAPSRTKLPPKQWLRFSRILRIDGLLRKGRLHFGTGRLLVLGLQVIEGLNSRVRDSYISQVRRRVEQVHRYYNDEERGIKAPWGLNKFGLSLTSKEQNEFLRSNELREEVINTPKAAFRRYISRRFQANLGVLLRLNNAKLVTVLAAARCTPGHTTFSNKGH